MRYIIAVLLVFLLSLSVSLSFAAPKERDTNWESLANSTYIGSAACGECHKKTYANFKENSKKSQAFNAVQKMSASVPAEDLSYCPTCHSTGFKKGGFVDIKSTPQFADVGCESCHNAGSIHSKSKIAADINMPTIETCKSCHTEKVRAINYKPLMFSAAH